MPIDTNLLSKVLHDAFVNPGAAERREAVVRRKETEVRLANEEIIKNARPLDELSVIVECEVMGVKSESQRFAIYEKSRIYGSRPRDPITRVGSSSYTLTSLEIASDVGVSTLEFIGEADISPGDTLLAYISKSKPVQLQRTPEERLFAPVGSRAPSRKSAEIFYHDRPFETLERPYKIEVVRYGENTVYMAEKVPSSVRLVG